MRLSAGANASPVPAPLGPPPTCSCSPVSWAPCRVPPARARAFRSVEYQLHLCGSAAVPRRRSDQRKTPQSEARCGKLRAGDNSFLTPQYRDNNMRCIPTVGVDPQAAHRGHPRQRQHPRSREAATRRGPVRMAGGEHRGLLQRPERPVRHPGGVLHQAFVPRDDRWAEGMPSAACRPWNENSSLALFSRSHQEL